MQFTICPNGLLQRSLKRQQKGTLPPPAPPGVIFTNNEIKVGTSRMIDKVPKGALEISIPLLMSSENFDWSPTHRFIYFVVR